MAELTLWNELIDGNTVVIDSNESSKLDLVVVVARQSRQIYLGDKQTWYVHETTPEDAITALEEAIAWIRGQTNGK